MTRRTLRPARPTRFARRLRALLLPAACGLGLTVVATAAAAAGDPFERDRGTTTTPSGARADTARNPVLAIVRQMAEEAAAAASAASASAGPAAARPIAAVSIGASSGGSAAASVHGRTPGERILP